MIECNGMKDFQNVLTLNRTSRINRIDESIKPLDTDQEIMLMLVFDTAHASVNSSQFKQSILAPRVFRLFVRVQMRKALKTIKTKPKKYKIH